PYRSLNVIPQLRNLWVSGNIAADTTLSDELSHKEKGPQNRPFSSLFVQFDNLFDVDFKLIPLFIDLTLNFDLILRGDGLPVPAFVVNFHIHRTGGVAEQVAVVGQALGNVTAQFDPAVVLLIFDFGR